MSLPLRRLKWIRDHLDDVPSSLKLNPLESALRTISGFIVVGEELFSPLIRESEIPVKTIAQVQTALDSAHLRPVSKRRRRKPRQQPRSTS